MPCPELTSIHLALQTPEEERKRLLSFVVCGGGPTGVEVAAEMHDMIFDDLKVGGRRTPAHGVGWHTHRHIAVCLGWSDFVANVSLLELMLCGTLMSGTLHQGCQASGCPAGVLSVCWPCCLCVVGVWCRRSTTLS